MKCKDLLTGIVVCLAVTGWAACNRQPDKLPVLGERTLKTNPATGKTDTVYPSIPTFHLTDQDSAQVKGETFSGHVYVADFIFLSCPTICPKMTKEMLKVYHAFENDDRVSLLSHTIDPEYDTIPRLKQFARSIGVRTSKWHFVTAPADTIYKLAASYYATAYPDSTAEGGFTHSGGLLLVDENKHIRGVYDGTDSVETKRLIKDISQLLIESR